MFESLSIMKRTSQVNCILLLITLLLLLVVSSNSIFIIKNGFNSARFSDLIPTGPPMLKKHYALVALKGMSDKKWPPNVI